MYKVPIFRKTNLHINQCVEGETIEMKVERIVNNGEPIKDGAPLIYTDGRDGVKPEHNIRTDRWEIAVDGADKIEKSYKARREEKYNPKKKEDGGAEPTQGKGENPTGGEPNKGK